MVIIMAKRFAAHILAYNCEKLLHLAINNCAPFVEKIYIAYSSAPWTYNANARQMSRNTVTKDFINTSKHIHKIEIIEGLWDTEEDQRNACLAQAKTDGMDYLIIQDADEFYSEEDYKQNLSDIEKNPYYDLYTTPWYSFWKTLDYVIIGKNNEMIIGYPQFAINCHKNVKFNRCRFIETKSIYQLAGLCFHLSYVLSDEEVLEKISIWGHSQQFDFKKWYKRKWEYWDESSVNLHPIYPDSWKKAIPFKGNLPSVLVDFISPPLKIKKMNLFDTACFLFEDSFICLKKAIRKVLNK
ncbi:MAG: hypothetical protein A2Y40_05255 [Candidatus Margulisbacteria bacterium GWF2_35_9]|nr:MAG: hypothetical protein A2Y40_05255 [Candidatus Margulisbacteria bacterium GWF2_35_9]